LSDAEQAMNERRMVLTPDILVAYVDRELPADQMAEVEAALPQDRGAQEIVHKLRVSSELAKGTALDALNEPLPLRLVAAARGASGRRSSRTLNPSAPRWLLPLAASIAALVIGLAAGYQFHNSSNGGYVAATASNVDALGASYEATLQGSLDSNATEGSIFPYDSPSLGQGKITLGHRFSTATNRNCREFSRIETRGTDRLAGEGIACRAADGSWSIMFFRNAS
jgi:hypothetical protein